MSVPTSKTLLADPGGHTATQTRSHLSWRVVVDGPGPGSRNMALDHSLAGALRGGEGVLRLYGWATPTVSFGRNEPAKGRYSIEEACRLGVHYVRRPTGGRAVMHDDELTYAVVVPERSLGGPRSTYLRINEALVRGLRELGVDVRVATDAVAMPPDAGPCFQVATAGEVTADNRKLVGSAQARLDGALLQHGSLLISGDQSVLAKLGNGLGESGQPATLRALLDEVPLTDLMAAVVEGFRVTLGGSWLPGGYRPEELSRAERLEKQLYAQDEWTWRR